MTENIKNMLEKFNHNLNDISIEEGDVVLTRTGDLLYIIRSEEGLSSYSSYKRETGWSKTCMYIADYKDDYSVEYQDNKNDIMAIYKTKNHTGLEIIKLLEFILNKQSKHDDVEFLLKEINPKWDWTRSEPKKMTIAEIEEILGYPIKIVEDIKDSENIEETKDIEDITDFLKKNSIDFGVIETTETGAYGAIGRTGFILSSTQFRKLENFCKNYNILIGRNGLCYEKKGDCIYCVIIRNDNFVKLNAWGIGNFKNIEYTSKKEEF